MTREGWMEPVTDLLVRWSRGEARALDQLLPLVYSELHRLAEQQLRHEPAGHTLQPTALVHEVYLKLTGQREIQWESRTQFFALAARIIRRILVDHARARLRLKRGGRALTVSLEQAAEEPARREVDLVALDDAMLSLARIDDRQCRLVELRYFGGLSIEETAHVLEISPATVKRQWTTARAWLYREMTRAAP